MAHAPALYTPNEFFALGHEMAGFGASDSKRGRERFTALYGCSSMICAMVWNDLHLHNFIDPRSNPKHFLWALHLLKAYKTEVCQTSFCKCSEKTAVKWTWYYIRAIKRLRNAKIRWPMFDGGSAVIFATVDGVHCKVQEVGGFDPAYYSKKFNSSGLAYEIVVDIHNQQILSINGPFPAGTNDLQMLRDRVLNMIPVGHRLLGDKFYRAADLIDKIATVNPEDDHATKELKKRALARHETLNSRLKNFAVLRDFRPHKNKLTKHRDCFEAVCVIVQYTIETEKPLFDV